MCKLNNVKCICVLSGSLHSNQYALVKTSLESHEPQSTLIYIVRHRTEEYVQHAVAWRRNAMAYATGQLEHHELYNILYAISHDQPKPSHRHSRRMCFMRGFNANNALVARVVA